MIKSQIDTTSTNDISALQQVLDQTELFPGDMLPDMIKASLTGESKEIWLTYHLQDVPVGFCFARAEDLTDGAWNMLAIAVLPSLQGKKVGSALVQELEGRLKNSGQRILIVDTSSKEEYALTREFYVKNQYTEEARIRDFWAVGDDKVTYRKVL